MFIIIYEYVYVCTSETADCCMGARARPGAALLVDAESERERGAGGSVL